MRCRLFSRPGDDEIDAICRSTSARRQLLSSTSAHRDQLVTKRRKCRTVSVLVVDEIHVRREPVKRELALAAFAAGGRRRRSTSASAVVTMAIRPGSCRLVVTNAAGRTDVRRRSGSPGRSARRPAAERRALKAPADAGDWRRQRRLPENCCCNPNFSRSRSPWRSFVRGTPHCAQAAQYRSTQYGVMSCGEFVDAGDRSLISFDRRRRLARKSFNLKAGSASPARAAVCRRTARAWTCRRKPMVDLVTMALRLAANRANYGLAQFGSDAAAATVPGVTTKASEASAHKNIEMSS